MECFEKNYDIKAQKCNIAGCKAHRKVPKKDEAQQHKSMIAKDLQKEAAKPEAEEESEEAGEKAEDNDEIEETKAAIKT